MGKVDYFRVEYHNGKTTFFPGEVISGAVKVKVNSELRLRGIRVEFYGEARVHFSRRDRGSPACSEVYIDGLVATLFGKAPEQAGENPTLLPSEYSFPFEFHTPSQNLPTSFEGKYGHVRYWLKAIIDRPWRFDITSKSAFTIIEYVNINTLPGGLLLPCQRDLEDTSGCCVSGPLTVSFQTDRGGYCPGESIGVSAFINNRTWNNIRRVEITLIQTTNYSVKGGQKPVRECVATVKRQGVESGGHLHLEMVPLPIPSLPPTMTSCSCIKISYELKFELKVSSRSTNPSITIPVTIGSVPYQPPYLPDQQLLEPSAPLLPEQQLLEPSAPPAGELPPSPPEYTEEFQPAYPGVVLPSYAECVYGGSSIRDENDAGNMMGDTTFTPMYPFVNNYQFPSVTSYPVAGPSTSKRSET